VKVPKTTVIIPAFNEERTIGKVIRAVRKADKNCRVLVGDNGSTDETANEIVKEGIVPIMVRRRGKGNVIRRLLALVKSEFIVMVDADNTYPVGKYLKAIEILLGRYDVIICNRKWKSPASMSKLNRLGNWCMSWFASLLYGYRVEDVCTGLWGFRWDALRKFRITSSDGVALECELFALAAKNGCSIYQFPIEYKARVDGSQAKVNVVADGFRDIWMLVKRRFV
jgi:dolichol-phosphate mannosyltransferase